jgi:hypothetical protein
MLRVLEVVASEGLASIPAVQGLSIIPIYPNIV